MRDFLERLGGFLPAALALALPTVFIPAIAGLPSAVDAFILPRAALVLGGASVGVGLALLTPGNPGLGALRWPLMAAVAAALLAFAFSTSWPLGLAGAYTRYESLPMRLAYVGMLASSAWLLRRPRDRELVVAGFVAGTAIACLEALFQINAPFRPDGNLGNANLLAALIVMAVPLALARGLRVSWWMAAWFPAITFLIVGLLVSTSRSGFLGAMAGALALIPFMLRQRFPTRRLLATGAALAAAAVVAIAVAVISVSPLSRLNDDPPDLRLHLWQDGLRMLLARPLTGWGEDTTGLAFGQFLSHNYAGLVTFDRVHSGPLDIAVTQGVLGLVALGSVLAVLFYGAWKARFPGDAAALMAALVGYSVWVLFNFDWAPATGAFWLLAGTAWAWVRTAETTESPQTNRTVEWRRSVAAIACAVVAIALTAPALLADVWYYEGRADLSVKVDPLQSRYHWSLGDTLATQGQLQQGVAELQRAAALGETEPGLYVDLGANLAKLGRFADARAAYRRALFIDPYYTPASAGLAAVGQS